MKKINVVSITDTDFKYGYGHEIPNIAYMLSYDFIIFLDRRFYKNKKLGEIIF